jgi:hypothetical protein
MTMLDAGFRDQRPGGPAPTIIGAQGEPRAHVVLRSAEFRRGREESWRELEDLVRRVESRGIHSVSADELQKMPLLYRATLSSLSVARSIALDRNLLRYLEGLTLRAYLVVYGPRTGLFSGLGGFFRRGFPAAVRKIGWHILISFAALMTCPGAGDRLQRRKNCDARSSSRPGPASRTPSSSSPTICSAITPWWPSSPSASASWPACRRCC